MVDHDVLLSLGHGTEKWYLDTIVGTTCDALKFLAQQTKHGRHNRIVGPRLKLGLLVEINVIVEVAHCGIRHSSEWLTDISVRRAFSCRRRRRIKKSLLFLGVYTKYYCSTYLGT